MQEIVQICLHFIWSIQIKIIFLHPQTKGNALLAQLVEQLTLNQWVQGSNIVSSDSFLSGKYLKYPGTSFPLLLRSHVLRITKTKNQHKKRIQKK